MPPTVSAAVQTNQFINSFQTSLVLCMTALGAIKIFPPVMNSTDHACKSTFAENLSSVVFSYSKPVLHRFTTLDCAIDATGRMSPVIRAAVRRNGPLLNACLIRSRPSGGHSLFRNLLHRVLLLLLRMGHLPLPPAPHADDGRRRRCCLRFLTTTCAGNRRSAELYPSFGLHCWRLATGNLSSIPSAQNDCCAQVVVAVHQGSRAHGSDQPKLLEIGFMNRSRWDQQRRSVL